MVAGRLVMERHADQEVYLSRIGTGQRVKLLFDGSENRNFLGRVVFKFNLILGSAFVLILKRI